MKLASLDEHITCHTHHFTCKKRKLTFQWPGTGGDSRRLACLNVIGCFKLQVEVAKYSTHRQCTSKSCQALSTISSVFAANQICKMHKLPQARRNCINRHNVPDYKMHQADSSKEPHKKIHDKNISKSPHAIVCPSSCKVQYSPTMYKQKLPSS